LRRKSLAAKPEMQAGIDLAAELARQLARPGEQAPEPCRGLCVPRADEEQMIAEAGQQGEG
jgi:hypothetical protein